MLLLLGFETVSHDVGLVWKGYVDQAGFQLTEIRVPLPVQCWH